MALADQREAILTAMARATSAQIRQTLFGQLARDTRIRASLRLLDVALALRISPSFISDIERGVRRCPSGDLATRWAIMLGMDPRIFEMAAGADHHGLAVPGDPSLPTLERLRAIDLWDRPKGITSEDVGQLLYVFDAENESGRDSVSTRHIDPAYEGG
jgi:transcriptional regulator with XRE-family HTH domain